mmetsp:Transcript_12591/g.15848  ORF Transcript_12591/g.15848 Transcript_12591/m.15848 type:complete len:154 (-) Transcript_12591:277-738(-)|eukprot:CAMPEP_0172510584 /NCGR_PEP_ID=MMETSP1066-20121228/229659_1 /TAXON_ID=671091 /ORGANISM="Coscinodiscus wailesii, Strain CCMP2513" /LENGTH=153 /DNA_ID=CAMNT_0013289605 /DNA_START=215 /DNA_END=676 /DNA_ORIENTATION=+
MDEFKNHMNDLTQQTADAERDRLMYEKHEIWRQTTWAGFIVRKLQDFGKNRFFLAVAESVRDQDEDNIQFIVFRNLVRITIIAMVILFLFSIGKVLQMILGHEFVVEQEIVVVEEIKSSELKKRRSAKDKRGAINRSSKHENEELRKKSVKGD